MIFEIENSNCFFNSNGYGIIYSKSANKSLSSGFGDGNGSNHGNGGGFKNNV